MGMEKNPRFRQFLQNELLARLKNNPMFSLRAFSKVLGLESSSLSQILRGKRTLTDKMCLRIGEKLAISPADIHYLMGKSERPEEKSFIGFIEIETEKFKVITDWYHYAILELIHLPHFQGEAGWISKVLDLSIHQTNDALRRLMRLGFLEITNDGKWRDKLGDANNAGNEFTHTAFRNLQKQILSKGIEALDKIPYDERIQTSMTLPVSQQKLTEAKKKILSFIDELNEFLREDEQRDEVYHMSFSLYPVSQSQNKGSLS